MSLLEDIQVILELIACLIELNWLWLGQPVLTRLVLYLFEI
jgi:hypothetical protein